MIINIMQQMPTIPFFLAGRAVGFGIIFLTLLLTIYHIYTKKKVSVRLLPQVEAMRESVGRCAEMGRPLVYTYGNPTSGVDYWTVASLDLLRFSVEQAAKVGVNIVVPLSASPKSIITHALAKDIVKNAYVSAGTPEMYKDSNFRLTGTDDQTWGLAITKILNEVRPAAHFFLGAIPFFGVVFGEAGSLIGDCISIGSCAYMYGVAQTVVTCDYTFIAQDLVAASAYITKDPSEGGYLRTLDIVSLLVLLMVAFASILLTMYIDIRPWLGV